MTEAVTRLRPESVYALEMAKTGVHPVEIARQVGYSYGGVMTLLRRHGVKPERQPRGGQPKMSVSVYGCDAATVVRLNDGLLREAKGSKALAYYRQRGSSKVRGIAWEITFPEWVDLWLSSGKWNVRGPYRGQYVMARHGDQGPYRLGNVSIATNRKNNQDALTKARPKITDALIGSGRGWTYVKDCTLRPYQASFRKKCLGHFATQAEAEAAYRRAVAEHLTQPI